MNIVGLIERTSGSWRLWRIVIAAAVLLVVTIGGLIVWHFAREYGIEGQLSEAVAALDRDDPHWRLADSEAGRTALPDAQNSALVVLRAAAHLPALPPQLQRALE